MHLRNLTLLTLAICVPFMQGCAVKNQGTYKNLAIASDTASHSLKNVADGVTLAVQSGVMSPAEKKAVDEYIVKLSQSGLTLDQAIKSASTTGATVQQQLDAFLDALNGLQTQVMGIKDAKTRLEISTAIAGIESAVSVISAQIGAPTK